MTKKRKQPQGFLIVYGLDKDNRPHAARFEIADQLVVEKAAALMGFKIGVADSAVLIKLAKQLPTGKIFATGRSLVPYIKDQIYRQFAGELKPISPCLSAVAPTTGNTDTTNQNPDTPVRSSGQSDPRTVLQTTTIIGITASERERLLASWPAKDRKVPGFCERFAAAWDTIWLSAITTNFGDRAQLFCYGDFEKRGLARLAPTVFCCWQKRWLWGLFTIPGDWQLWTGLRIGKDGRSIQLLFDITDERDDRHPGLEPAIPEKSWKLKENKDFEGFESEMFPVAAAFDAKHPGHPTMIELAAAAIAIAVRLLQPAKAKAAPLTH